MVIFDYIRNESYCKKKKYFYWKVSKILIIKEYEVEYEKIECL